MAVIQLSKLAVRSGSSGELPQKLDLGELGFTTDTNELFVGSPDGALTAGRNTYPYQNVKVLTEFDVMYGVSGNVYHSGPLKTATTNMPGNLVPLFPLFLPTQREFVSYDVTITDMVQGGKTMFTLNAIVNTTTPTNTVFVVNQGSIVNLNWVHGQVLTYGLRYREIASGNATVIPPVSPVLSTGNELWLCASSSVAINNQLKFTISGKEWSNP